MNVCAYAHMKFKKIVFYCFHDRTNHCVALTQPHYYRIGVLYYRRRDARAACKIDHNSIYLDIYI